MKDIGSLHLADARIVRLEDRGETLTVAYVDWQDRDRLIVFEGVVAYQSFSAIGRDLSHAMVLHETDRIAQACKWAEEDTPTGCSLYAFIGAWDDVRLLEVIAKGFRLDGSE